MVRYIGGMPVNPVGSSLLSDALIYRPDYGGAGLLDDGADFDPLRNSFAGGMLAGYQIDPTTGMPRTVTPSGVYAFDPTKPPEEKKEGQGEGDFTISDLMEMQVGMSQANFGMLSPETVFQYFDAKDNGTFDLKDRPTGQFAQYLYSNQSTGEGDNRRPIPLHKAISESTGEPIGKERAIYLIKNRLAGIDESGGNDGDNP